MIFVTVGTQLAFDRMIRVVDAWAGASGRADVFAQIGPGAWRPSHIEWSEFVTPGEFDRRSRESDVIIGHAGMGAILTAMQYGKPIVIMPRRAALREQRNDHQVATARRFSHRQGITVAMDEHELVDRLDQLDSLVGADAISDRASDQLINAIREFIHDSP
ncbi:MAG: hypothetical protein IH985_07850 [Planctomycetes bacterium]|nr:hypothetical protein [Planctomycetota bacterium]